MVDERRRDYERSGEGLFEYVMGLEAIADAIYLQAARHSQVAEK
jgi:hypothetical protein